MGIGWQKNEKFCWIRAGIVVWNLGRLEVVVRRKLVLGVGLLVFAFFRLWRSSGESVCTDFRSFENILWFYFLYGFYLMDFMVILK